MQRHVVKIVPANWSKLISDRFYRIRKSKLKNIVTKIVEIQVEKSLFHNSIEKMRDPSHVRIYSLSEIEEMFNVAGTDITDITHWEIPQDFEEWMTRAGSDKRKTEMIESLMVESIDGDRTGLWVKFENGKLGFTYDTIILTAQVRR